MRKGLYFSVRAPGQSQSSIVFTLQSNPLDTRGKLKVHKTFRRRPECLVNDLYLFNLRPLSKGSKRLNAGRAQI